MQWPHPSYTYFSIAFTVTYQISLSLVQHLQEEMWRGQLQIFYRGLQVLVALDRPHWGQVCSLVTPCLG